MSLSLPISLHTLLLYPDPFSFSYRLRQHLALSYRLLDRLSLNEGSCNHLSVMAPARDGGGQEVSKLDPYLLSLIFARFGWRSAQLDINSSQS